MIRMPRTGYCRFVEGKICRPDYYVLIRGHSRWISPANVTPKTARLTASKKLDILVILFTCIYWILTWIQSVCMLVWISGTVAGLMLCFVCIVVRDKSTSQINASGDVVVCLAFPVRTSVKFWSKKLNDLHFFGVKCFDILVIGLGLWTVLLSVMSYIPTGWYVGRLVLFVSHWRIFHCASQYSEATQRVQIFSSVST